MKEIKQALLAYLGAKEIVAMDVFDFDDTMRILAEVVYEESAPLYKNQLIKYTMDFEVSLNNIHLLNPTRTIQVDYRTGEQVNWSSWWPDDKVQKQHEEQVILACLEYYLEELT